MANVGKLTVSLTALTGRFGKGMRKASRTVAAFASEVGAASARLTALSAGAATIAATAIGYLTHRQMEAIDTTAKVADRLGATTEELLGMRHAANLAGVGVEEFDKAQEKLSKNLGNPTKETAEALDKIGLSAADLLRMSPAQRFGAIADGINKLSTQAEKAAVAQALFGKTGAQLLNTMDGGSKSIRQYTEEVKQLGYAYSRIEAAKVEEANDSITKLRLVVDGVFAKLAVEFSPFITELATKFLDLGSNGRSAADLIGEGIVDTTRDMLRLADVVDLLVAAMDGLRGIWHSIAGAWKQESASVHRNMLDLVHAFGGIGDAEFADGLVEIDAMFAAAEDSKAAAIDAFAKSRKELADAIKGERSGKAKAVFDSIRTGATNRATAAVDALAASRKAATSANAAKMIGDAVSRAFAKGNAMVSKANSQLFIGDTIKSIGDFFRTLPERALAAGVQHRDPIDVQTSVRGSFSGETAGRMSGNLSIQTKQLEEQRKMAFFLENINGKFTAGVPLQ